MYARQTPRPSGAREISLPGNYGGTAFRHDVFPDEEAPSVNEECNEAEAQEPSPDTHHGERSVIPSISGHLFPKNGGIGFEELLILGIILLVSQSSENDDNISLLLLLLLFIR